MALFLVLNFVVVLALVSCTCPFICYPGPALALALVPVGAVEALVRCVVGDLAHPLVSYALAHDEKDGMMTMTPTTWMLTHPTTTTTNATAAGARATVVPPLLTDVEIEVWWSSLITLGHLLTDCLPAKAIVDTSPGLEMLVRALLPLTRSLDATRGGGGGGGDGGGQGVANTTSNATATSNTTATSSGFNNAGGSSSSSGGNGSVNNIIDSITSGSSLFHYETVPCRPTIISTLLLGTITITTTPCYYYFYFYDYYCLCHLHSRISFLPHFPHFRLSFKSFTSSELCVCGGSGAGSHGGRLLPPSPGFLAVTASFPSTHSGPGLDSPGLDVGAGSSSKPSPGSECVSVLALLCMRFSLQTHLQHTSFAWLMRKQQRDVDMHSATATRTHYYHPVHQSPQSQLQQSQSQSLINYP